MDPEAPQRIARHAEGQLALSHHRHADALLLEVALLGFAVGPRNDAVVPVDAARDLDDAPAVVRAGRGDDERVRALEVRVLQDSRPRRIAIEHRQAALPERFDRFPIALDHDVGNTLALERTTD